MREPSNVNVGILAHREGGRTLPNAVRLDSFEQFVERKSALLRSEKRAGPAFSVDIKRPLTFLTEKGMLEVSPGVEDDLRTDSNDFSVDTTEIVDRRRHEMALSERSLRFKAVFARAGYHHNFVRTTAKRPIIPKMEAGGVEPPSEKPCHSKTTCLSRSGGFTGRAQNGQDA